MIPNDKYRELAVDIRALWIGCAVAYRSRISWIDPDVRVRVVGDVHVVGFGADGWTCLIRVAGTWQLWQVSEMLNMRVEAGTFYVNQEAYMLLDRVGRPVIWAVDPRSAN